MIDDRYGTGDASYDAGYEAGLMAAAQTARVLEVLTTNAGMTATATLVEDLASVGRVFVKGHDRSVYIEALNELAICLSKVVGEDTTIALSLLAATLEDLDYNIVGDVVRPTPRRGRRTYTTVQFMAQAYLVLALECMVRAMKDQAVAAKRLANHLGRRRVGLEADTLVTWYSRFKERNTKSGLAQRMFDAGLVLLDAGRGEWADLSAAPDKFIHLAKKFVPNLKDLVPKYDPRET
jgi:hypothetical protein